MHKEEIKKLYQQGKSQAELSRLFGLSRQRIHQIVKDYGTENFDLPLWKMLDIRETSICELCGIKAQNLHHRDFNNSNGSEENIQPLCKKCHYKVHKERSA